MSRLNFMIGLPRSGKSTFCNEWKAEAPNRVVLTGDSFRYAIYNKDYQYEGEELVRGALITATRALLLDGYTVLVDETNTTPASIEHLMRIDIDSTAYIMHTSTDICVKRAIKLGNPRLEHPIRRMANNLKTTIPQIESQKIPLHYVELGDKDMFIRNGYWR